MNWRKSWYLLVLAALLLGLAPTVVAGSATRWTDKVDPFVLSGLDREGQAEFYVIMKVQADLSLAATLPTKAQKGTYVYETLHDIAAATQAPLLGYLQAQGADYESMYVMNTIHVRGGDLENVRWLASRDDVAQISVPPDPHIEPTWKSAVPNQRPSTVEWNITRLGAPAVWAMGYNGQGMVVGDNDTGMQYNHPAIVNHYRGNLGGGNFDHNYNWWDAYGGSPSPTPVDYDGHGTHTAGIMVGDDGGANQVGMAPGAKIIACAGLNLECFEFFLAPWDLNHNNPRPDLAPDSINNSWYDSSGFDYRPIIQSLNAAGIAVIKSAGNQGSGCTTITNPGYVPEIIATAAFAQGDTIASFSSRGPSSNYGETILKPEVAAPGVNVRSSYPTNGYTLMSGTSMAAPHSTALVALIWSAAPCIRGDVPLTKQIMMQTAESKIDGQCAPFVDHPNDVWGWGILDAPAAVQMAMGYCGGSGWLEGTVTDAVTTNPIVGATVAAVNQGGWGRSVETDAAGYYVTDLFSGTYTVTASAFGYIPQVATGIVIEPDLTLTLDFALDPLPTYVVSGNVTDAATGAPLAATVEIIGTPLGPVNTDPSTGFYSVTLPVDTYTFHVTSSGYAPLDRDVVVDQDQTQNFALYGFCDVFTDTVEGGNVGWTPGGSPNTWAITTESSHSPTHSWTDSPGGNYTNYNDNYISSPVFDLSGYTGVTLNFWHIYNTESGYDYGKVEYSTNGGGTWTEAASYDGNIGSWEQVNLDLPQLDGQANARIRFHFTSDGSVVYDGWHVDDVVLSGGGIGCAQAAPPVASFDSTSPVCDGQEVSFTDTSFGGVPPADQFLWDFGDGATSTLQNPTHTYPGAGNYVVSFELCNSVGCDDVTGTVDILPLPVADFDYSIAGLDVTFTNLSTDATDYLWDFGDGVTSTLVNPVHTYALPGVYTVTLVASNGCGDDQATAPVTIVLVGPPLAAFSADPLEGCAPLEVAFTDESYGDPPITGWLWAFGDGITSTEQNPVHLYADAGEYVAILTVENLSGTASAELTVTVNPLPVASFSYDPALGAAPLTVWFTDTSSGAISPTWDFGDGNNGAGAVVSHVYATAGDYTVTLNVESAFGCGPASAMGLVRVIEVGPPVAAFSADPVEGCAPLTVSFTDESYGAPPITDWLWEFGDGATSTEMNPTHEYTASGVYEVVLAVTNLSGTVTAMTAITVNPVPEVSFVADPPSGPAPLAVTFYATFYDAISPTWSFGDGGTGEGALVTHEYTQTGTFTATLTVQSLFGCGAFSYEAAIVVTEEPSEFFVYLPVIVKNH